MNLRRSAFVALLTAIVVGIPSVASAAGLYWTNVSTNAIQTASLTGSVNGQPVATATTAPWGVTTDGSHVYWAAANSIGRSNMDGSEVEQSFIAANSPQNVAVNDSYIYWTQGTEIMRAAKSGGSGVSLLDAGEVTNGITLDAEYVYWTTKMAGHIGRAKLDGTGVNPSYITALDPGSGIVVHGNFIYFTGGSFQRLARVQNAAGATVNDPWVDPWVGLPYHEIDAGLTTDGTYLYWVDACSACNGGLPSYRGNIGRVTFEQGELNSTFISGIGDAYGIAASAASAQTITFPTIADTSIRVGSVELSATASSGLPVTFTSTTTDVCTVTGAKATFVKAGTCSITASQAGNSSYSAATDVSQSFKVEALPGGLATKCPTGSCAGVSLRDIDLSGQNLAGIDFAGALLEDVNLSGADLNGANLANADIDGVDLSGANLTGANFESAVISATSFEKADLTNINLKKAGLLSVNFTGAVLTGATFTSATVLYSSFSKASLANANFYGAAFIGNSVRAKGKKLTSFAGAKLMNANFTRADAHGVSFKKANATKAIFNKANLKKADFRGAKLKGAKFKGAKTKGAKGL